MNSIHAQLQSINKQLGYYDYSVKEGQAINCFHENVNRKALQLGSCAQAFGNCLNRLGILPSDPGGSGGGGGGKRGADDPVYTNINVYVTTLPPEVPPAEIPAPQHALSPALSPDSCSAPRSAARLRPASCYYDRAGASSPSRWGYTDAPAVEAPCEFGYKRCQPWDRAHAADEGPCPQKRWCQGGRGGGGAGGGSRPFSSRPPSGRPPSGRPPSGRPSSGRRSGARPGSSRQLRYNYPPRNIAPCRFQPLWEGVPVPKTWDAGAGAAVAAATAFDTAYQGSALG